MTVFSFLKVIKGNALHERGPKLFFFPFGPGIFYPLRVPGEVQNFFGCLVGPLTLLHPKMKLLRHREPRELETWVTFKFNPRIWPSNSSAIHVQSKGMAFQFEFHSVKKGFKIRGHPKWVK